VLCELEGRQYAVVSALSFTGDDKISMSETVADFDCEGTDDRLDRRRRNWIPQVTTNESLV